MHVTTYGQSSLDRYRAELARLRALPVDQLAEAIEGADLLWVDVRVVTAVSKS